MSCYETNNRLQNSEATTRSVLQERGPPGPVANEGQDPETDDQHQESNSLEDQEQLHQATLIPGENIRRRGVRKDVRQHIHL